LAKPIRARHHGLSRHEIADVALELVDTEGLEALSMRRLAGRLEIGAMTVYGYFRDKDDLLDAVVDAAAAKNPLPRLQGTWKERLRALIRGAKSGLAQHPSLVELRLRRPLLSPGALRITEAGVSTLIEAGFDKTEASRAFRVLFLYVFGFVGFSAKELTDEVRRQVMAAGMLLSPDQYPTLTDATAEQAETLGGEEQFEFGLGVILDGLEARLKSQSARRHGGPGSHGVAPPRDTEPQ
jgi:AcrR family transcriptional regulator